MRFFNTNEAVTLSEALYMPKADDDKKARAGEAYKVYDRLGNVFVNDGIYGAIDGVSDYIQSILSSPSTYIGFGVAKGVKGIGNALKAAGIGLAIAAFAFAAFKIVEAAQENQKIMNENFREQKFEMQGRPLDEIQQYNFDQALNQGLSDQPTTFGAGSITGMYTPAYIGERDSNFDIFAEYGAIPFGLDKKNFDDFIINKLKLEEKYKQLVADKVIDVEVIDNGTIDLSNNNQIRQYKENNLPANEINTIASMNGGNPYMEQVPELFGFADLVYQ